MKCRTKFNRQVNGLKLYRFLLLVFLHFEQRENVKCIDRSLIFIENQCRQRKIINNIKYYCPLLCTSIEWNANPQTTR